MPRKPREERVRRAAAAVRTEPRKVEFSDFDPDKWTYTAAQYDGRYHYQTKPQWEEFDGSIESGLDTLKENPSVYEGLMYQTDMTEWPEDQQKCKLLRRTGCGFRIQDGSGDAFTFVEAKYQTLEQEVEIETDEYTDDFQYEGYALSRTVSPGRGSGVADMPGITIIREVDPCDISQGRVGDCWLLSAISALAEYDGAIARLFRRTPDLESRPYEGPNKYVVTLWDLESWSEVDIEIDERLCLAPNSNGLLGCAPSVDGELWVPYLEKAIAAHCGGWDNINGGSSGHAFSLLTGCREQYTIRQAEGGWRCYGKFNPNTDEWEEHTNNPHAGFRGLWPMAWPEVGGGGDLDQVLTDDDFFERLAAWEDEDFIMCCGTRPGDDSEDTDGIVDGHAYTILQVELDVAGTGFNMIKVRNPWGSGEFKSGNWDDDGPGWEQFPEVHEALQPAHANDGIFWLQQQEFFEYFQRVYMSAKSMAKYFDD
mmetsp:Transcript_89792/g.258844  ORF Transcript_89792/g.258844 Transcript_89792/m.258844 type:complete len:481 (+) Transcript_89792:78-1520(+)